MVHYHGGCGHYVDAFQLKDLAYLTVRALMQGEKIRYAGNSYVWTRGDKDVNFDLNSWLIFDGNYPGHIITDKVFKENYHRPVDKATCVNNS